MNDQQIRTELKAGIRDNEVLNLKINNYLIEVICMVSPVKNFARVGHDLYHLLMVEDEGNRTDININNRSIRIDYDENFKSGERVIIKDGGFPTRNNNRGNLIVFLVRRRDSHLMNILSE